MATNSSSKFNQYNIDQITNEPRIKYCNTRADIK